MSGDDQSCVAEELPAPALKACLDQLRAPSATKPLPGPYLAEVVRVLDGNTIEARVSIWPDLTVTTSVRLADIDAPELHGPSPEERRKAKAAADTLEALLVGDAITLYNVKLGKYAGRVIASVEAGGQDVGAELLRLGLARPYDGGYRQGW